MRDYIELTKPRITWLILMSTAIGYFFGLPGQANWWEFLKNVPFLSLFFTMLGTGLLASGTAALNQWYEREADRKMRRTAMRPLPSGRMSPGGALAFGIALSVAGFVALWLGVNLLSALIGAFTLASYLFLYTPMKQRTWWSTTVGAVPGAMPPLIGYAAAAGAMSRESLVALLTANYLGEGCGAARLALDPRRQKLLICERVDVTTLDGAAFEQRVLDFVDCAAIWRSGGLDALLFDHSPTEDPAETGAMVILR